MSKFILPFFFFFAWELFISFSIICWNDGLCSIELLLLLCQKSIDSLYGDLFWGSPFCSTDLLLYSFTVPQGLDYCSFRVSLEDKQLSVYQLCSVSTLCWIFSLLLLWIKFESLCWLFPFLYVWIIFHVMNKPHFVYIFISWRTFMLFPHFGYVE